MRLSTVLLKISSNFVSASICGSPMLEYGAAGAGYFNAWKSSFAAMVVSSEEDQTGILKLWGKIQLCHLLLYAVCY